MDKKTISVCIPVYNEAENLPRAVEAVEALFREDLKDYALELIVTDNASTDDTWRIVHFLAQSRPHMHGYRLSRNFGYQNSVFAGLSLAHGDAVVELDADLEDPPHVIARFVERWREGYDVVYGVRVTRHTPRLLRLLFAGFYRVLSRISEFPIPEDTGDFRLLDRKVVDVLKSLPERNLYLRGLVSFVGFKQAAVSYDRQPRLSGRSKFRLMQYVVLAIDAITAFSKTPLRLVGMLGALLFVASMLLAIYYAVRRIVAGTVVPGFTTLVILMLLLHSVTFIFLGILGEYLSRIFDDSKKRPRVVIAEATESKDFLKVL
ncbi:MAG: glycosyltransferase family 2 protein [Candidatus Rokubacteria bacterium]|nr:glycosyltransferase family 2 protein [Candidatus Rokubacteria bacterium]